MSEPIILPLTGCQRDIWTSAAIDENDPQYNCVVHERLTGRIDIAALRSCLAQAIRRHDGFALVFDADDGVPRQWCDPAIRTAEDHELVRMVDMSDEPNPRTACEAWVAASLNRPFALRRQRMFEVALLRENSGAVHLLLKAHHIIVDGYGAFLLTEQVFQDYESRRAGNGPLTVRAPSFADVVAADLSYRSGDLFRQDQRFHVAYLEGATPHRFARNSPIGAGRTGRHSFVVDSAVIGRLREQGRSVYPAVAAAVAVYLGRVHRTDEVVVGVPMLNRRTDDELRTVGQFANALPLRIPVPGSATVRAIAAQVEITSERLQQHERLPFGDLLRSLPRGTDGTTLPFDVTVSYLPAPPSRDAAGLVRNTSGYAFAHSQDALALHVVHIRGTDQVRVTIAYAEDIFDGDYTVEALAGHLVRLLHAAADEPDRPIRELRMLGAAERARIDAAVYGAHMPFDDQNTVHKLFRRQTLRTPQRRAVLPGNPTEQTLTFAGLDDAADRIAGALHTAGIGRGDRVAVLLRRSPQLVAAILGVLKAGGAYVPVDPDHPRERIAFVVMDSGAKVVITGPGTPADLVPDKTTVLDVHTLPAGDGSAPDVATGHDLAYVIYTSGSTGRPKGVMVEHRSVVNRLIWMQRYYPVSEDDIILHKTPATFDVSVWELFWWALSGAAVALAPLDAERDPRELSRVIAERRVTVLHFVPSMLGPFLDHLEESAEARAGVRSLRYVFCSGEALSPARVEQFNRVLRGPRLINLYGPTEATVDVSRYDCPDDSTQPVIRVPIGRPVDNTSLYVLGDQDEPQPIGVPGELCIGGVQVARGYLNRPELSHEKFIDDPFTTGGTLYRTGDLARRLADGDIEYLGRLDGQVKIRGNRVETGEVTAVLSALPDIREAVVVARTDVTRGTYLAAYYVAEGPLTPQTLRDALSRRLPAYMIPASFQHIENVPLTPHGKADYRALPEPDFGARTAADQPPTGPVEVAMAAIWAEALQVSQVSVTDDYYALGGDSITMLRILALAEKRELFFQLQDLLRHPTVAGLAPHVTCGTAGPETEPMPEPFALVPGVDRAGLAAAQDAYPLTRLQLGLIYHSSQDEGSAVYRDVFRYSLELRWEEPAFQAAVDRLTARHPALRSSFDLARFSDPLQIVHPEVTGTLEVADMRKLSYHEAETRIAQYVEQRRHHRYALDKTPLYQFRAHLLTDTVELVLSFHHALLDGGSVATLLAELLQDYAHRLGLPVDPVSPEPLPSAAAFVRAERAALNSADSSAYWRRQLDGAQALSLDGLRPYLSPAGSNDRITHIVYLPEELAAGTRQLARHHNLPVKSMFLAAHCLTLGLLTGTDDVTSGVITHGRPDVAGADRLAGLFLNTIPIRLRERGATWLDPVREVFRQERECHPHRRYPLSAIQDDHGVALVRTAFNYVHFRQFNQTLTIPGIRLRELRTWEETDFELLTNVFVEPGTGRTGLRLDCAGSVLDATQVDRFAQVWLRLLRRMIEQPGEQPGFAFLTTRPEPASVISAAQPDVVSLFRARAAADPHAIAIKAGTRSWAYVQLADAARAVAHRLRTRDMPPGALVGIAMDRSPEGVAVTIGILMAGGAVVPLDTHFPRDRIDAMLEQAKPFVVVADEPNAALVAGAAMLPAESMVAPTAHADLPDAPDPAALAYVLFTSGSTGRPKGVAMPHRSLSNLVAWQNARPSGAVGSSTLQYAPLSFDVSLQEIFSTLCGGGTLHLVTEEQRRDMPELLRMVDREGIERVFMPYVALRRFADTAVSLDIVPRRLRWLISSGEQLRVTDEIRRLLAALPNAELENQYGPTESHVVTAFTMHGDPAAVPALPPIGKPIDGCQVYLLDQDLRPVPAGVRGEIHLGGICLAQGYVGQRELTDERFVASPFGCAGEVLYRTGDLGVELPSGDIAFMGRRDTQVKVRGYRVEPMESELTLTSLAADDPGIREVAVVARAANDGETFLAAFLTGDPVAARLNDLRSRLRTVLPDHLVPTRFTWTSMMPLTPSGKRDDSALQRLPLEPAEARVGMVPPRDALEKTLTEMVEDLLGSPAVGVNDNMFDLGGTSLTAMRLVVLVKQRYGVTIPLSGFLTAPTVAELATNLRNQDATPVFDPVVPMRMEGDRRPLFLVHPMGGNVLCYLPLANHLPADQPLYALQAAGAEPGVEPLRTMEELAASYVRSLRAVQPQGPYTIGGWSFGGMVAYEMARQLCAAGEKIADLFVLDTVIGKPQQHFLHRDEELLTWFFSEMLLTLSGTSRIPDLPAGLSSLNDKFAFIAQSAVKAGALPVGGSLAVVTRLFRLYRANWDAALNYRPRPGAGSLTLVRASDPLPEVLRPMHDAAGSEYQDPANGWRSMTPHVEVITVPGDHLSMMKQPNVAILAKTLADLLCRSS